MKIKKYLLAFFISILFTFNVQSDNGAIRNERKHQYWNSAQLYINNQIIPRISTYSSESRSWFTIDLYKKDLNVIYDIKVITPKNDNDIGTSLSPKGTPVPCSVRVDQRTLYSPKCAIQDDNIYYYATLKLDSVFIEECKKGNTVRIKFDLGQSIYYRYTLNGFTSALNRGLGFLITDEDYFNAPNSQGNSPAKTDASYFDI